VTTPAHWSWRIEPARSPETRTPAVVVDVDGVLSNATGRQHLLEPPDSNWPAFFEASGDDPVIEEVRVLLDLLDPQLTVVLLTARPQRVGTTTQAWLARHAIRWDLLVMRPSEGHELAREFKRVAVRELRSFGYELRLALEDDRRNVEMFQDEGVPCVYLHSGYYD
jgi:hypothetical protein